MMMAPNRGSGTDDRGGRRFGHGGHGHLGEFVFDLRFVRIKTGEVRHMLVEGAAMDGVDDLSSAADREHRDIGCLCMFVQAHFEPVTAQVGLLGAFMRFGAVEPGSTSSPPVSTNPSSSAASAADHGSSGEGARHGHRRG